MRYLGIDYGDKRIGVALSDEQGVLAFPLTVVANDKSAINELKKICVEQEVERVIFGLPLNFKMQETEQANKTKKFAEKLSKEIGLSIEFDNEIMTSSMATKEGVSRKDIDKSSAALILQSWIDKIKK